jgi:DNA-binding transcriptional MerR regulator
VTAAQLAGITYRQLDYWARTGLVNPSVPAAGSGSRRAYSYEDVVVLTAVAMLVDGGVRHHIVRSAVPALRRHLADSTDGDGWLVVGADRVAVVSRSHIADAAEACGTLVHVLSLATVTARMHADSPRDAAQPGDETPGCADEHRRPGRDPQPTAGMHHAQPDLSDSDPAAPGPAAD